MYKGLYFDDGENAYDYLKRRTSPEFADYVGDPVIRAAGQYSLKDMSKLNYMAYSMNGTNIKLQAFRHGMGSLPAKLSKDLDIKYKTRVTHVEKKGDRMEVAWKNGESKEKGDFSAAVVAVWGDMVPKIVKGLTPLEIEIFNATQYSTTMTVIITMDKPMEDPFFSVMIAPGESDIMAAFCVEDAKGNLGVPKGKGCLSCLTKEEYVRAFKGTKEEFGEIALKDAMKFFPHMKNHVSGVHIFKWDRAVEKMLSGRFSLLYGMKAQWPKDRRFFLAGSYLILPGTDGALTSGQQAAKQVMKIVN